MTVLDAAEVRTRAAAAAATTRPGAVIDGLRRLEGGVSSLTFAATMSAPDGPDTPIVLKVAPPGLPAVAHRDVLRQARVLDAVANLPGVPVPRVLFRDGGSPPLFGMQWVPGQCWEPRTNLVRDPPPAAVVTDRARAAARALAHLHRPDPAGLGLGEPPTSPADEVARWAALLATVDASIAPGHEAVHDRLAATLPAAQPPRLLHGDYRLGNLLFAGPELQAVIDWEIWSVGDPRFDLAWLLLHTDPVHRFSVTHDARCAAAADGLPDADALLAQYLAVRSDAGTADLDWFAACCQYKIAATVAVLVKRNRRAAAPDPAVTAIGETLPAVLDRAHEHLDRADSRADSRGHRRDT